MTDSSSYYYYYYYHYFLVSPLYVPPGEGDEGEA